MGAVELLGHRDQRRRMLASRIFEVTSAFKRNMDDLKSANCESRKLSSSVMGRALMQIWTVG